MKYLILIMYFVCCNFYVQGKNANLSNANCLNGYIYFEGSHSCYGRGPEIGLPLSTWSKAEQYCEKHGGHLPSIHSIEESEYIVSISISLNFNIWVGLYSVDENYSWKWSDSTSTDYIPWFYGYVYPIDYRVNASCAYVYPEFDQRGSLVNDFCNNEQFFFCQIPAAKNY